uniref:Nephrocystin 3-like N-terminal domain-containing protein n=1 Tax=Magallana gigas TaxID=29159 RepID=K1PD23_MAGGI
MTTPEDTVGFGKKQIDPWCKHRWELIKLIDSDKEILREVFTLSESKISLPESMKNGEEFLDALDNYFEHKRDGIVDYLYRLASELKLHVNEGSTSVTSILETYKYQLREHNTRQKDCELVGREQEIECAIGCLRSAKCKGVWICGLGGMGKTSLAFEVCRRLFEEKWRIFNVELREQKYVRDLVRTALNVIDVSLLTSSSDEFSDKLIDSHATEGIEGDISDDNKHEFWKQRFVQKCCEYSDQNQVLILDNVDEIIASDEKSFYALLKSILERRKKVENSPDHVYGMYRFVITSRSGINPTRLENLLKEIELRGLHAENEMKKVTSLCGCCPLAMLSVLGALQSLQDLPRDLTECLQSSNNSAIYVQSDVPRAEMCLHQLFYLLDEQYKITLMQLSVFRTTHFSIEAATHVCGKSKRSGKANMKLELGLLKNLHFLETPIEKFPENGQAQPTLSEICYFHPLVYQVLKNHHSKFENYVTDARSRFVEHIDRVLSKTKEDSTSNLMKVMVTYEPHIQLFYDYVTQMPSIRPSFEDDVPSIMSVMNRERLTDLVLDDASKHKYIIRMISASKTDNKGLETVYYQIVLAKFYNDKDKINMCRELLEEIEDIVKSNENLSNEAIYIKRKQKSKDHIAALILKAVMYLAEANANYKEILHQIKNGGLNNWQRNKVLYDQIKHNHKRVLHQLNREKDDIDEVMNIYLDFEVGKLENNITRKEFRDAVNESSDSTHVEKESMNSDSLDSSSLLSSDSALGVTSKDEKRTPTYLSKKELVLKTTDIEYSSEKSCPVETSYRNQIDSGMHLHTASGMYRGGSSHLAMCRLCDTAHFMLFSSFSSSSVSIDGLNITFVIQFNT